jgi:hypothetical protein
MPARLITVTNDKDAASSIQVLLQPPVEHLALQM